LQIRPFVCRKPSLGNPRPTLQGLELGGLAGSTVAGLLSDVAIRRAAARGDSGGNVGRRIRVVMLYTAGMAVMLAALQAVPAGATALQWAVIAGLGFTIYGPQMLIGLSGAELVAPAAVGASQGILGWIGARRAAIGGVEGPVGAPAPQVGPGEATKGSPNRPPTG
jgi:sugar phosphate permease